MDLSSYGRLSNQTRSMIREMNQVQVHQDCQKLALRELFFPEMKAWLFLHT